MAKLNPAQAALVSSALAPAPASASALALVGPVTVSGCMLQPPPTVAKVGDVFSFNVADWKASAERYKSGPQDASRYLQFKIGMSTEAEQWVGKRYAAISRAKMKKELTLAAVYATQGRKTVYALPLQKAVKILNTVFVWQHKAAIAPWPGAASNDVKVPLDPRELLQMMNDGHFLLWKDLLDGEPGAPVAKTEPPFDDGNHKWVLRVGLTGRRVAGVNVATGLPQSQLEVIIKLQRLPLSTLDQIENALGEALEMLKSILSIPCKLLTHEKLQQVANYGAAFPNPTVQASMLAWQGAAQACGFVLPQPKAPPACQETAAPPPLLSPDPWWKVHQKWLVLGGVVVGAAGIGLFLRQRAA